MVLGAPGSNTRATSEVKAIASSVDSEASNALASAEAEQERLKELLLEAPGLGWGLGLEESIGLWYNSFI